MLFTQFLLTVSLLSSNTSNVNQSVERLIRHSIEDGLEATKTGDVKRFVGSMAKDAVIIDENKMWTRSEIASFAKDLRITRYQISEVKFKPLSSSSCVYAYRNLEIGSFKKTPFKLDVYITSVWSKTRGKWQCRLIQETNVKKAVTD